MEDVRFGEYPYLDQGSLVRSCAYSLDGKTFAAGLESVVFSPCGQQIASGSDSTVRLRDIQTGVPGAILSSHTRPVKSVVFSPSGQQIASSSDDQTVRLWNAQIGTAVAILSGHTSAVDSVVFSPSGEQIASGSGDNAMRLWGVETELCLAVLRDFHAEVTSFAWNASADGSYLATGCDDHSVRMWKVERTCQLVRLIWSSRQPDAKIINVEGLNSTDRKLLEQRAAISSPCPLEELQS
ncbi:unnamed protein product [Mortierella alpina]